MESQVQIHPLGHILVIKSSNCSNKLFLNSYNKCIRCTVDSCTVSKGLKHWYYGKVVVIYFYFISNFRENMDNQSSSRYVYISLSLSLNAPRRVDQHFVWHLSKSNNNIKYFAHYIYLSFCKGDFHLLIKNLQS